MNKTEYNVNILSHYGYIRKINCSSYHTRYYVCFENHVDECFKICEYLKLAVSDVDHFTNHYRSTYLYRYAVEHNFKCHMGLFPEFETLEELMKFIDFLNYKDKIFKKIPMI